MIDDAADERRALAAELAAELAALTLDDDDDLDVYADAHTSDSSRDGSDAGCHVAYARYVTLDIDALLRRVASESVERVSTAHEQQTALLQSTTSRTSSSPSSSWNLLRATVEQSDADFFQFIQRDLDEVHAMVLTAAPPTTDVPQSVCTAEADAATSDSVDGTCSASSDSNPSDLFENHDSTYQQQAQQQTQAPVSGVETLSSASLATLSSNTTSDSHVVAASDAISSTGAASDARLVSAAINRVRITTPTPVRRSISDVQPRSPRGYDNVSNHASASNDAIEIAAAVAPVIDDSPCIENSSSQSETTHEYQQLQQQQEIDCDAQTALQRIREQHEARQLQLQQTLDARLREQTAVANRMRELELELAAFEAEQQRAAEMRLMEHEDAASRCFAASLLRAAELQMMAQEDAAARAFDALQHHDARTQQSERVAMAREEQRERQRLQLKYEQQQQAQLLEAQDVLRRLYNTVIVELLTVFTTQQQQRDAERRREARELTQMRSHELMQRRVAAQQLALVVAQQRSCERMAMAIEDAAARTWACMMREQADMDAEDARAQALRCEANAATRRRDYERLCMAREDELARCVAMHALECERLRIRQREACCCVLLRCVRNVYLALALERWQHYVIEHCQQQVAIKRLQRFFRRHVQQRQQQRRRRDAEAEAERTVETAAAAMVVQSTFRGFSIRRKFANALAMAKRVGDCDDSDALEFGEVRLDDLIEMPPELADGWEDPVLPAAFAHVHGRAEVQPEDESDSVDDNVDSVGDDADSVGDDADSVGDNSADGDSVDNRVTRDFSVGDSSAITLASRLHSYDVTVTTATATEPNHAPVTLASTLWDKMRKMKQKQRHAADERVREQDPAYRLQKLLHTNKRPRGGTTKPSTSTTTTNNNQSTSNQNAAVPTIAWGSSNNSSDKKRPKVKLPSLVERLRKKTEAAR